MIDHVKELNLVTFIYEIDERCISDPKICSLVDKDDN